MSDGKTCDCPWSEAYRVRVDGQHLWHCAECGRTWIDDESEPLPPLDDPIPDWRNGPVKW